MNLLLLAIAQQTAPQPPSMAQSFIQMLPAFVLAFLIFHYMVIRPQQKKLKEQQELISSLKKNELVITSSGMVGRVIAVEGEYVTIEVAPNVRIKFETQHVAKRVEQSSQAQAA